MKTENAVRAMAGTLVIVGLALGYLHSPWWHLLTACVGINLLLSAFTGFCPAVRILKAVGITKDGGSCCCE